MLKIRLVEYSAILFLLGCILLWCLNYKWLALLLYVIWYLLYGFVGLASFFNKLRAVKTSSFFIAITIPYFLLPYRKAFYYFVKSINATKLGKQDAKKAFKYSQKVNPESLYTDNNKSIFYAYLAALYCDLNDKESALKYIQIARDLPHKEGLNENIEKVISVIES